MRTSFDGVAGVDKHVGILYGLGSGAVLAFCRAIADCVVSFLAVWPYSLVRAIVQCK